MKTTLPSTFFAVTLLFTGMLTLQAQYTFEVEKSLESTEVKSQGRTGTCWSFATSSFLESEAMRAGSNTIDLSEMYAVRMTYYDKARNYILRQGKANFSEGSLSHDVIRAMASHGVIPEDAYPGRENPEDRHDHSEMVRVLKGALDGLIANAPISDKWDEVVNAILDIYLGPLPEHIAHGGSELSPVEFAEELGIEPNDYVSITSFKHHPFYKKFILEIPDNYSNGTYYNVPLDDMMQAMDAAIEAGYTVAWDGDVSEKGFSQKNGIAVLPKEHRDDLFQSPGDEIAVDQDNRQANFESLRTTDDHLMHITGIARDQDGTKYYITKNSWGAIGPHEGYVYMSEPYVRMKTIAIMVNRNAVPDAVASKINL